MNPVSFRATDQNSEFLNQLARDGNSKTDVINAALDELRKEKLRQGLTELAKAESDRDREMAEWGMDDYLNIVDNAA